MALSDGRFQIIFVIGSFNKNYRCIPEAKSWQTTKLHKHIVDTAADPMPIDEMPIDIIWFISYLG